MLYENAMRAADEIRVKTAYRPGTAVILGSGLGSLGGQIEEAVYIPYKDLPGFPVSNVEGHAARFVFGKLNGKQVVLMQGRFHYYEGFTMRQVCFPVYVLHLLGIETIVITNACGGINETFAPGDLMLITDHMNLIGANSLIGENDERFGLRFPDMTEVYDLSLRELTLKTAEENGIALKQGVYAYFSGPCYETAAEIRAYKAFGADAVGMSTVPEATAANYLGMHVLGISCITNMATGLASRAHSHEEVLRVANKSGEMLTKLLSEVLRRIPQ
ncbi:MAG: purine-nucleoside phosphorylase [Solobacterium sp.]|nr:purine-nucleoside phosphorylase [Solobacterium sp.]